jgi:integrase
MTQRTLHKLSARGISTAIKPGRYGDGGGLYLVVTPSGSRKWVFRYTFGGGQRDMGLGVLREVTLAKARELASTARGHLQDGRDPLSERQRVRETQTEVPTFGVVADELVASVASASRNEKHRAQWKMTLTEYAKPLRPKRVDDISTADVLGVLKPLWQDKPETASRLRGRIERVLDAAKARGWRSGENPARWRGHLDQLLLKRKTAAKGHHAALPYADMRAFMTELRGRTSVSARALEFTVLTAARTGESIGATGAEFDLEKAIWTIPAARMKAGREHQVPLSERAIVLIRHEAPDPDQPLFRGARGRGLSNMAMLECLRDLRPGTTVHGFSSTFRDWAGDETTFPSDLAEAALAHAIKDKTEAAYRRSTALERRRALMVAWESFCLAGSNNVVQLAGRL